MAAVSCQAAISSGVGTYRRTNANNSPSQRNIDAINAAAAQAPVSAVSSVAACAISSQSASAQNIVVSNIGPDQRDRRLSRYAACGCFST